MPRPDKLEDTANALPVRRSVQSPLKQEALRKQRDGNQRRQAAKTAGRPPRFMHGTTSIWDTVSDVHWWGGCFPGPDCPAGDFILSFYSDNAGAPGVLIQSFAVGNANQAATGNQILGPFTEYQYSAFVGPLAFAPLTQFWLGISNDTGGVGGIWGIETTSDPNVPQFHAQFLTVDLGPPFVLGWNVFPPALAFNLTNDAAVPEPATLALLGLGLAGLAATRRRMR